MGLIVKYGGPTGDKEVGPDIKAWVEALTVVQLAWLVHVLQFVIEAQDSTMILQMYGHCANRWNNDVDKGLRSGAAREAQERFFSEEALERDEFERKAAQKIVEAPEESGIILPPGSGNHEGH